MKIFFLNIWYELIDEYLYGKKERQHHEGRVNERLWNVISATFFRFVFTCI